MSWSMPPVYTGGTLRLHGPDNGGSASWRSRFGMGLAGNGTDAGQRKLCCAGIFVEHANGVQREIVQVAAQYREFLQQIVGHRDYMATDVVRLYDIEELAWAG